MSQITHGIPDSGPGSGTVVSVTGGVGINITGDPTVNPTVNLNVPVTVVDGGTGSIAYTPYAVITAGTTATGSFQNVVGVGTSGQVLTSAGASMLPAWTTIPSGNITITGDSGGGLTGTSFTFTGSATGLLFSGAGTTESLTGTLIVGNGGTGRASLTNHGLLVGAGTSAITQLSVGASGTVLSGSTGADPVFTATPTVTSITIVNAPVASTDGTNKAYVDAIAAGLDFKNPCYAGSTATLNAAYNNGAAGIGATLTNSGAQAAFTIDGTTPPITSRILVKDQSTTYQNGIYILTTVGTGITNWVLTRSLDYNTPAQIAPGDIVPVINGTVNAGTFWIETATVATIGMDPITFTQFFGGGTDSFVTDSGTATASNGSITLAGGANISTSGTGSTVTTKLSGTTNHAVQLGNSTGSLNSLTVGTNGQLLIAATTADPSWVLATAGTGLSVTTNSSTLSYALSVPVSIANGGTNSTASNITTTDGVIYFDGTRLVTTAVGSATQVLTSNGAGNAPTFQAASGGGLTWAVITANQAAVSNHGYICNKAGTLTLSLPATSTVGDIIEVTGINTALGWQLTQASGQQIFFGNTSTTSGATGTLTSSATNDAVRIVCTATNTTWQVLSSIGNITVV